MYSLLDKPPHIDWMESIKKTLEKSVVKGDKGLERLYIDLLDAGTVAGLTPKTREEVQIFFNLSLFFTLNNAQEVLIQNGLVTHFLPTMLKVIDHNRNPVTVPSTVKIPFDEMVFTFTLSETKKYMSSFFQVFYLDEDWIDPKDGSRHKVLCIKHMIRKDPYEGKDGLMHNYAALMETLIIPAKLPKIYFPSYVNPNCHECRVSTASDVFKHLDTKLAITEGIYYCFKTHRTMSNCIKGPISAGLPKLSEVTYAQRGMANFLMINSVVNKMYASPKKIAKIQKKIRDRAACKSTPGPITERCYIEIKDEVYKYIEPRLKTEPLGTHASPSEHLRRAHERKLKNGRVITVSDTVVGKGNKKPVYVLNDKGNNSEKG
jgi:hypothetical protein